MRIKIDDKIYRLKEIESGVDSLMELVEETKYKEGDFLHSDWESENITIIYRKRNGNHLYYHASKSNGGSLSFKKDAAYWPDDGDFRLATESEKKELIDALAEVGKRWNAEKKCIEDIPVYNDGDFVVSEFGSILIFKEADGDRIFDHAYLPSDGGLIIDKVASYDGIKRHATIEEEYRMIEALAERGKRWNADKKCVEDIPKRKFKNGDKVTLKSGCISKPNIEYSSYFNNYIGKELEVVGYDTYGNVLCDNTYYFSEDWLEPWSDEPKVADWVIFWDHSPKAARVGILTDIRSDAKCKYGVDGLAWWLYAVKWDGTKEHLEKVMKGEI